MTSVDDADVTDTPRPAVIRRAAGRLWAGARGLAHGVGAIRIPDFLLFFLLVIADGIFPEFAFKPTALVLAAAVALAAIRRPQFQLGTHGWWIGAAAVALTYAAAVSATLPPDPGAANWIGRLLRLATVFAFLFSLASGRLDLFSGIAGYVAGMVLNIPLFYAGLLPDTYGGYLTGWFGDKNVSGLVYCTFGLMALWLTRSRMLQVVMYAGSAVPLWLTGSRTSIAAYVAAGLWIVIAPYVPLVGRWLLGAGLYGGVTLLATTYAQIWVFESRGGSDALRDRIDAGSLLKLDATGFFGRGFGSAFVDLGDEGTWFFHNSYWSALVEGGWPWLLFIAGMTIFVTIRPFTARLTREQHLAAGVGVALLVCASQLGEVFGTEQWAVVVALALRLLATRSGDEGHARHGGVGLRPRGSAVSSSS